MLGNIFGRERLRVRGECWKKCIIFENLNDLYCSQNNECDEIKNDEMVRACRKYGGGWEMRTGFGGRRKGNRPPEGRRHRWKKATIDVNEIRLHMNCIHLTQNKGMWRALVNMSLKVPQTARNFLTRWEAVSFSGRTLLHEVSHSVSQSD